MSSSPQCHEVGAILMTTVDDFYKSQINTSSGLQKYSPQETSQNFEYLTLQ